MPRLDDLRAARRAHEALRAVPPSAENLAEKAALYRAVKAVLDAAQEETDGGDLRRACLLLSIDAAFYAGFSDAEGFREARDAWAQYDELERAAANA
jgi:hypothetical protein